MSAPLIRTTGQYVAATAATSHTVPVPPGAQPGDVIVAVGSAASTVNRPSGWTLLQSKTGSTVINATATYYVVPGGGAPATVTWTTNSSRLLSVVTYILSNVKTAEVASHLTAASSATPAIARITTTAVDSLLLTSITAQSGAFPVAAGPSGYTAGPNSATGITGSQSIGSSSAYMVAPTPSQIPSATWDLNGTTSFSYISITIGLIGNDTNSNPSVNPGASQRVYIGDTVQLSASFTDVDGDSISSWQWACININTTGVIIASPTSPSTQVTLPNKVGAYTFRVDITDARGGTDSQEVGVVVTGVAPSTVSRQSLHKVRVGGIWIDNGQ